MDVEEALTGDNEEDESYLSYKQTTMKSEMRTVHDLPKKIQAMKAWA